MTNMEQLIYAAAFAKAALDNQERSPYEHAVFASGTVLAYRAAKSDERCQRFTVKPWEQEHIEEPSRKHHFTRWLSALSIECGPYTELLNPCPLCKHLIRTGQLYVATATGIQPTHSTCILNTEILTYILQVEEISEHQKQLIHNDALNIINSIRERFLETSHNTKYIPA